jgi:chemotaxis protein methyltransferase CheR
MDDFSRLLAYIERALDIRCSQYKEDYIRRRLMARMNITKMPNYREYMAFLAGHAEEKKALRNALTINVTKFFRDSDVFSVLRREIIPQILKTKKRIRIWSAGCSSGEEPYSFAMILHEASLLNKSVGGTIYATDIDQEVLERAKTGIYDKSALENLSEWQLKRHFTPLPDGKYEIRPHLKSYVRFQYHDLMKGEPVSRYLDIISCRNVTIYFDERQKSELVRVFHEGLVPEGYYIMGLSEYLGKEGELLFRPSHIQQKVYSRI